MKLKRGEPTPSFSIAPKFSLTGFKRSIRDILQTTVRLRSLAAEAFTFFDRVFALSNHRAPLLCQPAGLSEADIIE